MVMEGAEEPEAELVDLKSLTIIKLCDSAAVPEIPPKFKRGGAVTAVRNMSATVHSPGGGVLRRNIREGVQATVEGWAEADSHKVVRKVLMDLEPG